MELFFIRHSGNWHPPVYIYILFSQSCEKGVIYTITACSVLTRNIFTTQHIFYKSIYCGSDDHKSYQFYWWRRDGREYFVKLSTSSLIIPDRFWPDPRQWLSRCSNICRISTPKPKFPLALSYIHWPWYWWGSRFTRTVGELKLDTTVEVSTIGEEICLYGEEIMFARDSRGRK